MRRSVICIACLLLMPLSAMQGQSATPASSAQTASSPPSTLDEPQLGWREATILGLVEGITEFLPVSSTGHLLLANEWLGLNGTESPGTSDGAISAKEAADAYAIIIQAGAILAVLVLYWRRILQIALGVLGLSPNGRLLARNLLVAFLPAAVLGLLLNDWIESVLFGPLPIAIALVLGSMLMFGVESWRRQQIDGEDDFIDLHTLGIRQCLLIGLLQCVAMWPGMSRSMMTIVGGYLAGLRPARAAEFSFLLGWVTLTAAAGYKAVSTGPALLGRIDVGPLLLGLTVAFVSAALAVKWLVHYLTRHGLAIFAWYRLLLAAVVLVTVFYP
jgi:undecaprenyl-diphosphatase